MPAMTKHQREVAEFLRRAYGATETRLDYGGKHRRLRFRCRGREHSFFLSTKPGDPRAGRNIETELKRMLGDPISPARLSASAERGSAGPRTLEEMMTDLNNSLSNGADLPLPSPDFLVPGEAGLRPTPSQAETAPGKKWDVKVASYNRSKGEKGTSLWFLFPPEIRDEFAISVAVEKLDEEHWKITKGGAGNFTEYSRGHYARVTSIDHHGEPFGMSWAEAIQVGDDILVYLARDKRSGLDLARMAAANQARSNPPEPRSPVPPVIAAPPPAHREARPVMPPQGGEIPQTLMREILREVERIEALGPYRLTRLKDDKLVWRAPIID
jgi:hypothetical protein